MSWDLSAEITVETHRAPIDDRVRQTVVDLLAPHGLRWEDGGQVTLLARTGDRAVGTATLAGNVIKMVAIDDRMQGQGLMARLLTTILNLGHERQIRHFFVFTPPRNRDLFTSVGFAWLAGYGELAGLLEFGTPNLDDWLRTIGPANDGRRRGAIVVNCNPFTLGHRYLIETAAGQVDELLVFVLDEDRSLFPAAVRRRLVAAGTADLPNVRVHPSGPYIISAATFPAYFLRDADLAATQVGLDATIFASRLAPPLGIVVRFVGEEPYCPTTARYNAAMAEVFGAHGLRLSVVPRREFEPGRAISASLVRAAIRADDRRLLERLVPESTRAFLATGEAASIVAAIKSSDRPH